MADQPHRGGALPLKEEEDASEEAFDAGAFAQFVSRQWAEGRSGSSGVWDSMG